MSLFFFLLSFVEQHVYGAAAAGNMFSTPVAEEESSFAVVDNSRATARTRTFGRGGSMVLRGRGGQRTGAQRGRGGGFQRTTGGGAGGGAGGGRTQGYDNRAGGRGGRGGRRFGWRDYDKPQRNRDSSVKIGAEWDMLEEIDFGRLAKLNLNMDEGQDIDDYGFLYYYDKSFDRPYIRGSERKLQSLERAAYNVTTTADPVIQELAEKNEATVFATADILAMLMCSTRSVYSWDIVIIQQGDKIFLDKREGSSIDMVTVNENAPDAPLEVPEDKAGANAINTPGALALEAAFINHNFALQTVKESPTEQVKLAHPNPFYDEAASGEEPPASKGYKYRRYDLSLEDDANPTSLVIRAEVDAVTKGASGAGEPQQIVLKALNEFDNKAQGSGGALDWRTKLVSQRGAVVATEMKNNSCKLARWTTQALLAKADTMKIGFVSRTHPRAADSHVILGAIGYKPREFATQMNFSVANGWGIVRSIVDLVRSLTARDEKENGPQDVHKYVLVKDPNRPAVRLYNVPVNTFEEEEEEEEEVAETPADGDEE